MTRQEQFPEQEPPDRKDGLVIEEGQKTTPEQILKELVGEAKKENERTGNTPLNTGSSMQMAFKRAIDPEKSRLAGEGVLIGSPGNPKKISDVSGNLVQMGKIGQTPEDTEGTNVLDLDKLKDAPLDFDLTETPGGGSPENISLDINLAEKAGGGETEVDTGKLVLEKQRLIKLGKDKRTPEETARRNEITEILKKAGKKSEKKTVYAETPAVAPNKPRLSPAETKKFLEEQASKAKRAVNRAENTGLPYGTWEKKKLSYFERVIKRMESKGEEMTQKDRRELSRVSEEKKKLLSGWKKEDFELLALKRKIDKTRSPKIKKELEARLEILRNKKNGGEQPAQSGEARAPFTAENASEVAVTPVNGNNADQKREKILRTRPVLTPEDTEFLTKMGWGREDFIAHKKVFELEEKEQEVIRNSIIWHKKRIAEEEALETTGKYTDGQKAHLKNLKKTLAELNGQLTLQDKLRQNGWPNGNAGSPGPQIPSEAYGDDYLSRNKWGEKKAKERSFNVLTPEEWEKSEKVKKGVEEKNVLYEQETIKKNTPKSTLYMKGDKGNKEIRESISPAEKEWLAGKNRETRDRALGISGNEPRAIVKNFLEENYKSNSLEYFDAPEKAGDSDKINLLRKAKKIMESRLDRNFGRWFGPKGTDSKIWKEWSNKKMSELFDEKNKSVEILKMRGFMQNLSEESGVASFPEENIGEYVKMASVEMARTKK